MSAKSAESHCHSWCPHFALEKVEGAVILHCGVLPQRIRVRPTPDDAARFFNDIETSDHIIMPFPCQAVTPTFVGIIDEE